MRYSQRYVWLPVAVFLLLRLADGLPDGATSAAVRLVSTLPGSHWVATWGASPQAATAGNLSSVGFRNATIREIVRTSAGGYRIRVRLTNAFGSAPLRIGRAAVAVQARGASPIPGTVNPLYFDGRRSVLIAPGAEATTDPVALAIGPATHLVISLYLPGPTGPATQHADAEEVDYLARGPHVGDGAAPFKARTGSWYFLSGVDVLSPRHTLGSIVAFGDSITDGVGSSTNADARWPNFLARRLTLTPFEGARDWTPAREARREAINHWIRTSNAFDGVIDFAGAVADPNDLERLKASYDSGDHVHPNAAGNRAMAAAINLGMLL